MTINRGKKFEDVVRLAFKKVPNVSVDRLHDQTNGYKGSQNICDFIVYKKPYEYYIECKSVHGNTFPFSNITDTQKHGLFEKSNIQGVFAGIIVWWVDKDVTKYIPIDIILAEELEGHKSIRYDYEPPFLGYYIIETDDESDSGQEIEIEPIVISGKKKRVFFEYDMKRFFDRFHGNGLSINEEE